MVILTADGPLQNLLQGVKEPAEVRDKSGKVLGHYTPVLTPEEAAWYEKAKKLFDLEEAERVLATERDSGKPLQEFWHELKGRKDAG
jgi:hypothetical protein